MSESATVSHSSEGGEDRFLAHHFGSAQQQFDAGKLGMWLFLVTEVLFFSGLFCAYAVYRSLHPEAFADADRFLDVSLGAANTIVLLFSSLTMAWAVRAAQLGQNELLKWLLTITLACASLFLGVKAVEYAHKWEIGVLWAGSFQPLEHSDQHGVALLWFCVPAVVTLFGLGIAWTVAWTIKARILAYWILLLLASNAAFFIGVGAGKAIPAVEHAILGSIGQEQSHDEHHGETPAPVAAAYEFEGMIVPTTDSAETKQVYTGVFFSIYYVMTGLHAVHILAGMGVIAWILWRTLKHHFGPNYYGPVDYVGLYWHLVDLVWIFLFPLLYLIG